MEDLRIGCEFGTWRRAGHALTSVLEGGAATLRLQPNHCGRRVPWDSHVKSRVKVKVRVKAGVKVGVKVRVKVGVKVRVKVS